MPSRNVPYKGLAKGSPAWKYVQKFAHAYHEREQTQNDVTEELWSTIGQMSDECVDGMALSAIANGLSYREFKASILESARIINSTHHGYGWDE